jgi:ABC-type glycerol-3-phosphate transport system permease component
LLGLGLLIFLKMRRAEARMTEATRRWIATILVGASALVFTFPFAWMFFATFKPNPEIFRPWPLLPRTFHLDYYRALLDGSLIPFPASSRTR